jgi:hypothetical protein
LEPVNFFQLIAQLLFEQPSSQNNRAVKTTEQSKQPSAVHLAQVIIECGWDGALIQKIMNMKKPI